jgi:hypothetical protein
MVSVDGEAKYRVVGPDDLPIYVRREWISGRKSEGRIPRFYVFGNLRETNVDSLVEEFNSIGATMWKYVLRRVAELAATLDPGYVESLLEDYAFLEGRIKRLLNQLRKEGLIDVTRASGSYSVKVHLRHGELCYKAPMEKGLDNLV